MKEEIKEITNKMIKTSHPNGVFLTAETRDKIIYYINNSLEEIERLQNIIEEDKKIEKLKNINTDYYAKELYYENLSKEEITLDIQTLKHKVNEIIDKLNEMEKE